MADPYATVAPDLSGRPTGPPPYEDAVIERGGALVGADPADVEADARFFVIPCRGVGTLAPFARVKPDLATLLWLEHAPAKRSVADGNALLSALRGLGAPVLAIKQGCVGGPPDRPGCFVVEADLIAALLAGLGRSALTWEVDPDFGYELPSDVPGLEAVSARALLPRLLYADHDRVYEHADLVARKKRERFELVESLPGLAPEIAAAAGWPPRATHWREGN
ncbi:MAG: hypothetical protein M3Q53_00425 [Actinomycetota bacterium]|nr:hypothetical protein [Actinomycetota bacterium]